ncbi:uncharacterized protein DFL_001656 [Arthrobotrys flagrans]|uniref:Uncharacterized protein n=1 Tax=Arthrobotrys flagrans TaxID=97331 RepID=A0A437A904_ARTFL|nr:hypothetical protein DFL_001656 [Arthrobotrys flagrans]
MQYNRASSQQASQIGWLSLLFFFIAALPRVLAAPGAGKASFQVRGSAPKPGASLPVRTAIAVAPTGGLPGLHPETTAIAVIPKRRGIPESFSLVDKFYKKNKKKIKRNEDRNEDGIEKPAKIGKKGKVKMITVVRSIPVTATVLKRTDGGYPSPDSEGNDIPTRPPRDDDEGDPTDGNLPEEDMATVSVLEKVVPTDNPVVITSYECPAVTVTEHPSTPSDTPELAKQLINLNTPAKVSCFTISSELQADLASQTEVLEYVEGYFCDSTLSRTADASGVAHVVREHVGGTQNMSVSWMLTGKRPSKKECVEGLKMIWDKCANLKSSEGPFSGGKALFKRGVFYNLEAVTFSERPKKGKKSKAGDEENKKSE